MSRDIGISEFQEMSPLHRPARVEMGRQILFSRDRCSLDSNERDEPVTKIGERVRACLG